MIFSEIYGSYYKAMTEILKIAVSSGGSAALKDIRPVIDKYAFAESLLTIQPAISEERWQVIRSDGKTAISNDPTRPLTLLERKWLKAISLDPRIKLFDVDFSWAMLSLSLLRMIIISSINTTTGILLRIRNT